MIVEFMFVVYFLLAILQYFVAPKLSPNPFFGFRVGYTFSSREVWEGTNRFIGKIMIVHTIVLTPFLYLGDAYFIPFLALFVIPLIALLPIGMRYASHTLETVGARSAGDSARRMEPIEISTIWMVTPAILYFLLITIIVFSVPYLPERVAVHFDGEGNPNGWMERGRLLVTFPLLAFIFPAIAYVYIYISRRYPIITHPGKMRFRRDAILKMTVMAVSSGLVVLIMVYTSIVLNAIMEGFMKEFTPFLLVATFAILIPPFAWLFTKGRHMEGPDK